MALVLLIHFVATIPANSHAIHESPLKTTAAIALHSLSVVCVNCFILISGYFGITWKRKSFLSLLYQVLFWLIAGLLFAKFLNIDYSGNLISLSTAFFSSRWFVPAYLGLYIASPVLNTFIENRTTRELGKYILYFYIFSTIIGYLLVSDEFNAGMSVISLTGLYLLGAFIRRSELKILHFRPGTDLLIYLLLALALTSLQVTLHWYGIDKSPLGYINPVVIVMSVYLFLFFQKLNIKEVKLINYIAASSFAVYLFHFHAAIYGKFQEICRLIVSQGWSAPVYTLLFFTVIFIIAVAIDRIRIHSFKIIYKLFTDNHK